MDDKAIHTTFDAVFIDAAKGQYQRFFEKYAPLVKSGGVLYIDNMYMHGLSDLDLKDVPRRKRTMIRNLKTSQIGLCTILIIQVHFTSR